MNVCLCFGAADRFMSTNRLSLGTDQSAGLPFDRLDHIFLFLEVIELAFSDLPLRLLPSLLVCFLDLKLDDPPELYCSAIVVRLLCVERFVS